MAAKKRKKTKKAPNKPFTIHDAKPKGKQKPKKATPVDPTKPLKSFKQEAFAQNLINGEVVTMSPKGGFSVATPSLIGCYENAGYRSKGYTACASASRLLKNVKFAARLDHLRAEQAEKLSEKGALDKEESCLILATIARDERERTNDRIHAIKANAEIMGHNKADENDAKKVNVYQEFIEALIDPIPADQRSPQTG